MDYVGHHLNYVPSPLTYLGHHLNYLRQHLNYVGLSNKLMGGRLRWKTLGERSLIAEG